MAKGKAEEVVKKDVLQEALDKLNKAMGAGSVYEYKNFQGEEKERVSSGSLSIDYIIGGGYVKGLMHYISGGFSSGKSTLCLHAIKEVQRLGGKCAYIDSEYCLDSTYASSIGVDMGELIVAQPNCIEDGYQILIDLVETGKIDLVIFDSIAAAQTRKELEGDVGDHTMGIKAKLNSVTFPKICQTLKKSNTIGLFINQQRMKMGIAYGSPITEPGGESVKFYPSIKIEVNQSTKQQDGAGDISGNLVKAKCTKNKTSRPFLEASYVINYGEGVDYVHEIFDLGQKFGYIKRGGAWFSYEETSLGQGEANAIAMLKDNPDLVAILDEQIRSNF
jgi:recombination protein RecA